MAGFPWDGLCWHGAGLALLSVEVFLNSSYSITMETQVDEISGWYGLVQMTDWRFMPIEQKLILNQIHVFSVF